MPEQVADLVVEQSTTTTTGAYQLGGVPSGERAGAQGFVAGIGNGNTCRYYASEVGGTAWEKGLGMVTDAATDTLTRTSIEGSSNAGAPVDWTGKTVRIESVWPAREALRHLRRDHASLVENLTLATSRTGNAETIAVKTLAGANPSVTDPVRVAFAKTDGTFEVLELTAALSLTVSSGSTLGAINATEFKLAVVLINDAGTLRLGVSGRPSGLRDNSVVSSTAEGGAGAADTARTIYTGTAVTSKRMRVLGYLTYTLTTAGTWVTAPSDLLLTRAGAMEIEVDEVLYDVTLGSSGAFDTLDVWPAGLPTGYSRFDVELRVRGAVSAANDVAMMFFNADTTLANYSRQSLIGTGSAASSGRADDARIGAIPGANGLADNWGHGTVQILSPQDTSKHKNFLACMGRREAASTQAIEFEFGAWESAAAIASLQVRTDNHPTDLLAASSSMKVTGRKTVTVLM